MLQLKKLAEKLGPETTELQRFLSQLSGSEFRAPEAGTWNITETIKSATFSPLPRPTQPMPKADLSVFLPGGWVGGGGGVNTQLAVCMH